MSFSLPKRSPELDGLRGWACFSILLAHCFVVLTQPTQGKLIFLKGSALNFLFSGVDLFFVLSGFLIGGILVDTKHEPNFFAVFWIKRAGRILPVAYLLLGTYCIALLVTSQTGSDYLNDWLLAEPRHPIWTYATFTQSMPMAIGGYGPAWLGITWSLAIEEQFYILFPFAVYFLPRKKLALFVVVALICSPLIRDVFVRQFGWWLPAHILLPSMADGLLFGVATALLVRHQPAFELAMRWRRQLDVLAIALFCVVPFYGRLGWWPMEPTLISMMWALIILRVFTARGDLFNAIWLAPPLRRLGMISYGLYMYHQLVNGMLHKLIFGQKPLVSSLAELAVSLLVMAFAIVLALLSFKYYETPIREYSRKLARRLQGGDTRRTDERAMLPVSSEQGISAGTKIAAHQ